MRQTEKARRAPRVRKSGQDGRKRRARSTRYGSLTSFYTADPRRVASRERDVGLCGARRRTGRCIVPRG